MNCGLSGMRVIGLTGGIASGKSTVAEMFRNRGVEVIDADELSRQAVEPGSPGLAAVVEAFGDGVLNARGGLDRGGLRQMIFADPELRRRLEQILHPLIRQLGEERIRKAADAGNRTVVYMAPLLIEAGAEDRVDEIWVVSVRPDVQLERLMQRDGISREQSELIIASQMPLEEKARRARIVIDNNGTRQETVQTVNILLDRELGVLHE